jgi:N-methylhydantoinase A
LTGLINRFEETYEKTYGKASAFREAGIELTYVRLEALGAIDRPKLSIPTRTGVPKPSLRKIFEPRQMRWMDAAVHDWRELPIGFSLAGPAVIEHPETSVFVAAGQMASVDAENNITIEENESEASR